MKLRLKMDEILLMQLSSEPISTGFLLFREQIDQTGEK